MPRVRAAICVTLLSVSEAACTAILGIGDPTVADDGGLGEAPADGTVDGNQAATAEASGEPAATSPVEASVVGPTVEAGPADADATVQGALPDAPFDAGPLPERGDETIKTTPVPDAAADVAPGPAPNDSGTDVKGDGPALKALGDPCKTNADCASDSCIGWCTKNCTSSQDCGKNSQGVTNACFVPSGTSKSICYPGCSSTAECRQFNASDTCLAFSTVENSRVATCAFQPHADGGVARDGDPCASDTDCASGRCAAGWCTEVCATTTDCGSNSAAVPNTCIPSGGVNVCYPGCSATSQCHGFNANATCTQQLTVEKASVAACILPSSTLIGDKCVSNSDCASGDCNGFWCTELCATSKDCGTNSANTPNACVSFGSGIKYCVPGCSATSQCRAFDPRAECGISGTVENVEVGRCVVEPIADGGVATGRNGDPCKSNGDCASGTCYGGLWCTEVCASNQGCGVSTSGVPSVCAATAIKLNLCFPSCAATPQCRTFDPRCSCTPVATVDNVPAGVCNIAESSDGGTPSGKDGDVCKSGADCASGYCDGYWCSELCSNSQNCGSNSAGVRNVCLNDTTGNVCYPGCSTTVQCRAFDPTSTCAQRTDLDGGAVAACIVPSGTKDGDHCTADADCASGDCRTDTSGGQWCTEVCSTSTDCGTNSRGVPNVCVTASTGLKKCYPTCPAGPAQCQAFLGMGLLCNAATNVEGTAAMICGSL